MWAAFFGVGTCLPSSFSSTILNRGEGITIIIIKSSIFVEFHFFLPLFVVLTPQAHHIVKRLCLQINC